MSAAAASSLTRRASPLRSSSRRRSRYQEQAAKSLWSGGPLRGPLIQPGGLTLRTRTETPWQHHGMAGVDTIRGIAYQQMQATLMALDVLDDLALSAIRVEGADDVVDVEIFSTPGKVHRAAQIKTKASQYAWAKGELTAILRRWAGLSAAETARFEFITDGRLGPSAEKLSAALAAAQGGDLKPLAELLGESSTSPVVQRVASAQIRLDPATVTMLWHRGLLQVIAMLPRVRTEEDANEQAALKLGALARLLTARASDPNDAVRTVSREEIAGTLGVSAEQSAHHRWPGTLRDRYLAAAQLDATDSAVRLDVASHERPTLRRSDEPDFEPQEPLSILRGPLPAILAGRTGTGKTTAARGLRQDAATAGSIVLLAQAESYISGRLDALVSDAVSDVLKEGFPAGTGRQILADPTVALVIDGVSEIPEPNRIAIADELSRLAAQHSVLNLVLVGRDIAALRATLPTTSTPSAYVLIPMDYERRRIVAADILRAHLPADAASPESSASQSAHVAVVSLEKVLGDAASNALLFRMGISLYAEQAEFRNRATMYERFIESLAARTGAMNISIASAALSIVFAKLLDEGRRYADPLEWLLLLHSAATELSWPDASALDATARRCGLIVNVGYTQNLAPMHDSFADYLAGWAAARGLVRLPETLRRGDVQRILFAAEIGGLGAVGVDAVARDLPFSTVQISEYDNASPGTATIESVSSVLQHLLPASSPSGVLLARTDDDRVLAALSSDSSRHLHVRELLALSGSTPLVVVDGGGDLAVAVRLWRSFLSRKLAPARILPPPRPRTREDACAALAQHARMTAEIAGRLIAETAPPGHESILAAEVGPLGIDASVGSYRDDPGGGHWPATFRRGNDIHVSPVESTGGRVAVPMEQSPLAGQTSTSVEGMIRESPEVTAANMVRDAIEELTVKRWLLR